MSHEVSFTAQDVEARVRLLAEQYPEHRYPEDEDHLTCRYVEEDDTPGCLFGIALHGLGVSIERLRAFDDPMPNPRRPGERVNGTNIDLVLKELIPELAQAAPKDVAWFRYVQIRQDMRMTWQQAVAVTDRQERFLAIARLDAVVLDRARAGKVA